MRNTPVEECLEEISTTLSEETYGRLSDAIYETNCEFDEEVASYRAENAKLREDMEDLEGYDQMLRDRLRQVTELKVKSDSENAKLRKLNPLECALNAEQAYREQVDALVAEVKQLRGQRTARRIVVSDGGVGHAECGACGGAIDQDDAFCRHCGRSLEDA